MATFVVKFLVFDKATGKNKEGYDFVESYSDDFQIVEENFREEHPDLIITNIQTL